MDQVIIDLLFAIIVGVFTWAIRSIVVIIVPFVKMKLESSKYSWAAEIVDYAVRAYEQTVTGSKKGQEKFELVKNYVIAELLRFDIHLTAAQVDTLIEAAVQTMNSEKITEVEDVNVNLFDGDSK